MRSPVIAAVCVVFVVASVSFAQKDTKTPQSPSQPTTSATNDRPLHAKRLLTGASIDTFVLAEYTFEDVNGLCDPQGWISVDRTTVRDTFFHVDGFAGLGGGDFGRLTPLEGFQSMWCGATRDTVSPIFCGYADLPGYGNYWAQTFESAPFPTTGDPALSYLIRWDTEPNYDFVHVEYMDTGGAWVELVVHDGIGEETETWVIPSGALPDSLRIRFRFDSDEVFSDDDGEWNTDGAVIIDSITVSDLGGLVDFQDFEAEPVGARVTLDGDWAATRIPGYGDFAALYRGMDVLQEDACIYNTSCLWGFFNGSTVDYACGGHPEQPAVPFENERGQFLHNEIWSPVIDWTQDMHGTPVPSGASQGFMEFDIYSDNPLDNLVFWTWHVRPIIDGCPSGWVSDTFFHHGLNYPYWARGWRGRRQAGDLLPAGTTEVQMAIAARDLCPIYCSVFGPADCHSHGPLFDNVRLIRIHTPGPIWAPEAWTERVYPPLLFQDNFPEITDYYRAASGELTVAGKVRVDNSYDILDRFDESIVPGDSLTIIVLEPTVGLDTDLSGGPAVYLHVRDLPGKSGIDIEGGPRWPYLPSMSGGGWTVVRADFSSAGPDDQYCVDLNDNLYEPGDIIFYYLSARDSLGRVTYWSKPIGTTVSEADVRAFPMEMTCLPANALGGGTDILLVDRGDGGGVQPYFDYDFGLLGVTPDRFDINTEGFNNGPATRVKDVVQQLIPYYRKIIWSSGDVDFVPISDDILFGQKSDDVGLLNTFLDQHPEDCGVYLTGDNLGDHLGGLSAFLSFGLLGTDHTALGEPLSPWVIGQAGSCFDGPDTLVAHGGCPNQRDFDVMSPSGAATVAMAYSGNPAYGAVIAQETLNSQSATARVLLSGFAYDNIHDPFVQNPYGRIDHLRKALSWIGNTVNPPTGVRVPPAFQYSLEQNFPNPFNPSTSIRYTMRERSEVSLRIYNAAGQLVATLVNGVKGPGIHDAAWDGRANSGVPVSSGVYFYRLVTKDFTKTRKLVVVK